MNKKLESWRKFETAKGFVYALYEDKLCDGFQNTISVLSFLLKKVPGENFPFPTTNFVVGGKSAGKIGGNEAPIE